MTECTHKYDPDSLDTRAIGRLCDPCLANVHDAVASDPLSPHGRSEEFAFASPADRERVVAVVLGLVNPSPEEAHLVYVAARVVAWCDDALRFGAVSYPPWVVLSHYLDSGSTGVAELDDLCASIPPDVKAFQGAVDRVVEIADA